MQDGIEVILDKWDLKAGHDANVFMEKMVTDPSVTKVLMVCDKIYVEKANGRSGGVGTESQIISPELYDQNSSSQNKFAAITTEVDEGGRAYVPIFYKGRIYFDFTTPDRIETQYEELLRWLADKPRLIKPKLGSLPASIVGSEIPSTATSSRARRADEALRQGLPNARGILRDYVDAVVAELPAHALDQREGEEFDDAVVRRVDGLRPYVTEFQGILTTIARYSHEVEIFDTVLGFFERVAGFMYRPPEMNSWVHAQFDAYKIFTYDIFLSTFAILLKEERFDLANKQTQRAYVIRDDRNTGRSSRDFTSFYEYPRSLQARDQRQRRISVHADLISSWYKGHALSLDDIMQADFVLWISSKASVEETWGWGAVSLMWASRRFTPFEIFARAESRAYFDRLAPLLKTTSPTKYKEFLAVVSQEGQVPRYDYAALPVGQLSNADNLGVRA